MVSIRRSLAAAGVLLMAVAPASAANALPAGAADESVGEVGKLELVLDSSGSMKEPDASGTSKIKAARQALRGVVDGLDEDAQVGMRVFGATVFSRDDKGACTDSQQVVPIGSGNAAELKDAVGKYKPFGETPIGYALQEAAKDLGDEGPRTIMLVSDGEATCAPDPCKVAKELAADGIDLKIDVVGFDVAGKARKQLSCVAEKGNGTYYDVDDADQLKATMETSSSRALQPFEVTGTPIEGTPTSADAPEMETGGQYTDTIPARKDEKHYTIKRTEAGSNVIVGVSGRPKFGESDSTVDIGSIWIRLATRDGEECAKELAPAIGDGALIAGSAATINWLNEEQDTPCAKAEELTLSITQDTASGDVADTPIQFKLWEYGKVSNYKDLPKEQQYDDIPWEKIKPDYDNAETMAGAGSFAEAPELEAGTSYTDTAVPGEMRLYRVPVEWGQRLQAQVNLADLSKKVADELEPTSHMQVSIYGPTGADASNTAGISSQSSIYEGTEVQSSMLEVRYRNFGDIHDFSHAAAIPGDYYIGVQVSKDDEGDSYEVPFTLTTSLVGDAGAGEPEFSVVNEPGDVDVDAASQSSDASSESSSDDALITPTTAGIALGGLVLLLAGGFGLFRFARGK